MAIEHHTRHCASLQIRPSGNLASSRSITSSMIMKTAALAALLLFSSSVSASRALPKNVGVPLKVLLANKSGLKYQEFGTFVHPSPAPSPAGVSPRVAGVGQIPVAPVPPQPARASNAGGNLDRIRKTFTEEEPDQYKTQDSTIIHFKPYDDHPRIELDWNKVPKDDSFDKLTAVASKDNYVREQRNRRPLRRIFPESYPPHRRFWSLREEDLRDDRRVSARSGRYRVRSVDYERRPRDDGYGPRDKRYERRYEPRDDRYERRDDRRDDRYEARDDYRSRRFDRKPASGAEDGARLYRA